MAEVIRVITKVNEIPNEYRSLTTIIPKKILKSGELKKGNSLLWERVREGWLIRVFDERVKRSMTLHESERVEEAKR